MENDRIFHNRAEQSFGNLVGDFHITALCKIPFHRMHHDIRTPGLGLPVWKGHGQLRIHNGKPGPCQIRIAGPLQSFVFFCDNRTVAHFTACCSNRQYTAYRHAGPGLALSAVKIPDIPIICQPIGNGFRRINDAAPANSQNEINMGLPA